jgi:RNA ligase
MTSVPEATSWPGPVVERFAFATLTDTLGAPPRANREGLVVHVPSRDVRVKIKYEEYVRLHRLVTGLNARVIWEHLVALPLPGGRLPGGRLPGGADLASLVESLPDEFHQWVGDVAAALRMEVADAATAAEVAYMSIVDGLREGFTREDFALVAKDHPERGCLLLRLDGKDYHPLLWQRVRPEAGQHSPRATPFGRAVGPDAD